MFKKTPLFENETGESMTCFKAWREMFQSSQKRMKNFRMYKKITNS